MSINVSIFKSLKIQIEGTFKLNSPSILLGYEAQGMASQFGSVAGKLQQATGTKQQNHNSAFDNQKAAFITIFLTLQPSVTPTFALKVYNKSY